MTLFRALSAEALKLKRTPALLLALGVPVALCLLMLVAFTLSDSNRGLDGPRKWAALIGIATNLWTPLILPLGLAVLASLTVGLEWTENQWKHLLSLPVPRPILYLAKLLSLSGLVLLGSVVLVLGLAGVGWTLTEFGPIPWNSLLELAVRSFLASLPLLALQVWLSSRFRSFALAMGFGLAGIIAGEVASNSSFYWRFVPWTYPSMSFNPALVTQVVGLGTFFLILVLIVGLLDFSRKDIQ